MTVKLPELVVGTNSYISYQDADTYFANRFNSSAWDNLGEVEQLKGLITASKQISLMVIEDAQLPFVTIYNAALADAVCEQVLAMANDNAVAENSDTSGNVRTVKAGSASVEFFSPTKGTRFPTRVMEILKSISVFAGSTVSAPYASGITVESQFDDCDTRNLTRGLY